MLFDMSQVRLSPRLQALLDLALPGQPLWDICCDHGLLGLKAIEMGSFPEVHFVDQVPHIIRNLAIRLVDFEPDNEVIECHLCAGQDIPIPVKGSVVIAGVGAQTILDILTGLFQKGRLQAERLILSPQKDERDFPQAFAALFQSDWELGSDPFLITESDRERPIWVATSRVLTSP